MHEDIERIILTEEVIEKRVESLGRQIHDDYQGKDLLMVAVLKGALPFLADLARTLPMHAILDFMVVEHYDPPGGTGVRIIKDLDTSPEGKDILIVEDVIRQGRTLNHLVRLLSTRSPAGLKVCALIDKREGRNEAFRPDYVGFNLTGVFVVGYGLDYRQLYRNLPYVGTLKAEVFSRP